PLRANARLRDAAAAHTANMVRQNRLSHVLDGKDPAQRVREAGYEFRACGENIAYGHADAKAVVQGWMKSPGHRKNILNPEVAEIGVGVGKTARGRPFYCQVFAQPRAAVVAAALQEDRADREPAPTVAPRPKGDGGMNAGLGQVEAEIVRLTNAERAKN